MNTLPDGGAGEESGTGGGDFSGDAAFDAAHVYSQLQHACFALERAEEHAAAAYVSHAMAIVHDRFHVGHDHRDEG